SFRCKDLIRIATHGQDVLPKGPVNIDLAKRLAEEARTAAQHVLEICIRALDYCPPVDLTFGDYLRALITADFDIEPDGSYRLAFIEAFRARGLYPNVTQSMSVESLLWRPPNELSDGQDGGARMLAKLGLKDLIRTFTDMWRRFYS